MTISMGVVLGPMCDAEQVEFAIASVDLDELACAEAGYAEAGYAEATSGDQLDRTLGGPWDTEEGIRWGGLSALGRWQGRQLQVFREIRSDYACLYNHRSLLTWGAGLGVGALMANTDIDSGLQRHVQTSIRSARSDDWYHAFHANKELGNPLYAITLAAASWGVGDILGEYSPGMKLVGTWGERATRGYLVAVPHGLALQLLTGGSRPGEHRYGSHWRPFADDNGVSGHSLVASLPFITAAKMTDRPLLRGAFYFASLLGPLSRLNDDAHYPSQAFLGWWVSYAAASAVAATEWETPSRRLSLYSDGRSAGLAAEFRW